MNFNHDLSNHAQKVLLQKVSNPKLFFNKSDLSQTNSPKHIGVVSDSKLTFRDHLDIVFTNVRKTNGLLGKLNSILSRAALMTVFKAFVRPYLDYGDVLYDQAFNTAFLDRHVGVHSVQCIISYKGAIRGISREKLYQELGLESLQLRGWCRKLCLFYNTLTNQHHQYLINLIPARHSLYNTRNVSNLPFYNTKQNIFKNSSFPSTIIKWNKLDTNLRNLRNLFVFKKHILQFIRPSRILCIIRIIRKA